MSTDDYSYENLKKLKYIDNIEKETTRFYGPANGVVSKIAKNDFLLKGVPIKKGVLMRPQPLGLHYSDEYYIEPWKFRPERWEDQCNKIPPNAIGGFGGGPRACVGKQLAKLQAKIGFVKFFKRYEKMELPNEKIRLLSLPAYQPHSFATKLIRSVEKEN